ncbi:MAG: hydrolase [Dysgonamonadaceae bacterium]|jgi:predicted hydrolase (HD superfamily)|nr:hydrolase [Dysgonamonadaceae bacterium]MDD4605726.1 hydrolase [Dysgonamonadaceae bacterium]
MTTLQSLPVDNANRLNPGLTRERAWNLLTQYNKEPFHLQHAETLEAVMFYFARTLGYEDESLFWSLVGLLHDLDFEQFPEQHCVKTQEILEQQDVNSELIRAIVSHAYGHLNNTKPEHMMEKVLYATDELTGLIGATILMRPSKSTLDLKVSSVKKKFKDKKFAAGCSRDVIANGASMLGWELDYLIAETIKALQEKERNEKS